MIVERLPGEVILWNIVFHMKRDGLLKLVPGRFTHVSAFGYVPECKSWIYLNMEMSQMRTYLLPEGERSNLILSVWTEGCPILQMRGVHRPPRLYLRAGLSCVSFVKHLVGLRSGALLPDGLWRDCLRAGATELLPEATNAGHAAARPEPSLPGRAATGGVAGADFGCANPG